MRETYWRGTVHISRMLKYSKKKLTQNIAKFSTKCTSLAQTSFISFLYLVTLHLKLSPTLRESVGLVLLYQIRTLERLEDVR